MMVTNLLECVANFSEGRRPEVIEEIVDASRMGGVRVLDVHSDPDHNRSVLTLVGRPDSVVASAVAATGVAARLIDLRVHDGVHPRMGAMDVIPFVPLGADVMQDAIEATFACARRINFDLGIPCFLFAFAALRRHTRPLELPEIRSQAFENLSPDFGDHLHPSAGATCVGAREVLVAFNVEIDTDDMSIARKIAHSMRSRNGGPPYTQALAFYLQTKGRAQISMNLTRPSATNIPDALNAVSKLTTEAGFRIVRSEVVGLAPRVALGGRTGSELDMDTAPKILEEELGQESA